MVIKQKNNCINSQKCLFLWVMLGSDKKTKLSSLKFSCWLMIIQPRCSCFIAQICELNSRPAKYCRTYINNVWFLGVVLCVQIDFTRTFEGNTKCNNINHVWSHFYKILVVLKYHRRPWANIFDTDICRSMNIPKNAKNTTLM